MAQGGPPTHWICYVSVPDCDAAIARAGELGGEVKVKAFTAPGFGRMAVIADPQGANIKPFQLEQPMTPVNMAAVGQFSWGELLTTDSDAAAAFYASLFNWETQKEGLGGDMVYTLFRNEGQEVGGALDLTPGAEAAPNWLPYITVDDVDARTKKVQELGGKVCKEPGDIPDVGRFSVVMDPQGASFALYASAQH